MAKKRSFFERLTGSVQMEDEFDFAAEELPVAHAKKAGGPLVKQRGEEEKGGWIEEAEEEGQLTVDVYQTPADIFVETMVAGVKSEDLHITITRDMITIRGKREQSRIINDEDYFTKELYWGTFSRTVSLPAEVEVEDAEAIERHGLLIVRLPKINKDKQTQLKVKSV